MKHRFVQFHLLTVAVLLLAGIAPAQQFPRLQEENLAGQQIILPDAASGKIAALILGFSRDSQKSTEAWARRILGDFGKNPDFVLYQLPVIEAAPRFVRGMITSGMRKGIPESQRPFFVPVVHQEDALKKLVNYKDENDAYIVVLDRGGKIVFQSHGPLPDNGYAALRSKLEALLH